MKLVYFILIFFAVVIVGSIIKSVKDSSKKNLGERGGAPDNEDDTISEVSELKNHVDFMLEHQEYFDKKDNELIELRNAGKGASIDDRIQHLEKAIKYIEEYKAECAMKGNQYLAVFEHMWEHCHNSKNPDFKYIDSMQDELDGLKKRRDKLKDKELDK